MFRVVEVTPDTHKRVEKVKAHALLHRQTLHELFRTISDPSLAVGNDPNFVIYLNDGFRVVYSIEQQPLPLNWCEHISISVTNPPDPKKPMPGRVCVGIVLQMLFHHQEKDAVKIWVDEEFPAVNFLFKYNGAVT